MIISVLLLLQVSEALDAMFHDTFLSGKKTLQDLSEIQKMSSKAENDWKKYIEKTDSQIRKDAKSVVEIRDVMENSVLDWYVIFHFIL